MPAKIAPFVTSLAGPHTHSIAELLIVASERAPNGGIYLLGDHDKFEFLKYSELLSEARHILAGLKSFHVRPKEKVALLIERRRDFLPAFWACVLGGHVACPLAKTGTDPQRWAKHISYIDALLGRPLFLGSGALLEGMPITVKSVMLTDLTNGGQETSVYRASASNAAVMMVSSGSAGYSKAVELTHGNIWSSIKAKARSLGWNGSDIMLSWIGFDEVAALLESHMIALHIGADQIHLQPDEILASPMRLLALIHDHRMSITFARNSSSTD